MNNEMKMPAISHDTIIKKIERAARIRFKNERAIITTCVWGKHGMSKTAIKHTLKGMGWKTEVLNPAQFEEMGDLNGMPDTAIVEGIARTIYALPMFAPINEGTPESPGCFIIDDFNRANARIVKGMMQFIQELSMGAWKLPKGWVIYATANPSDGSYGVTEIDNANITRLSNYQIKMSNKEFIEYASDSEFDPRLLLFLSANSEIVNNMADENSSQFTVLRTLENLSHIMKEIGPCSKQEDPKATNEEITANLAELLEDAKATIDDIHALSLHKFCRDGIKPLLTPEDILRNDVAKSLDHMGKYAFQETKNNRSKVDIGYYTLTLKNLFMHLLRNNPSAKDIEKAVDFLTMQGGKYKNANLEQLSMARKAMNFMQDKRVSAEEKSKRNGMWTRLSNKAGGKLIAMASKG